MRNYGSCIADLRIAFRLPDYKQLRIPEQVMKLSELNKGLVLVTGPAGSGKSTTLACMIEEINETKEDHIITLEDPLEFLHQEKYRQSERSKHGYCKLCYFLKSRIKTKSGCDIAWGNERL